MTVIRPDNHIGPGQRREFLMRALAHRMAQAADGAMGYPAGNVNVRLLQ